MITRAAEGPMPDWTSEPEYSFSPAANWVWFAPAGGRSRALVVGDITPAYQRGLSAQFERVDSVPLASLHSAIAGQDRNAIASARLSYDLGSVDCVISTDLVRAWPDSGGSPFRDARFVDALTELHRLLRAGGVLFLSGANARWHRALLERGAGAWSRVGHVRRTRPLLNLGQARAALAKAGFSETRAYFVDPWVGDMVTAVPACRRAAVAYERQRLARTNVPLRALCAVGGLYELLYREAFVVAIK